MKSFFRKNKLMVILLSSFIFCIFCFLGFAIYMDRYLKKAFYVGEYTFKIETINQTNHLVTPEVIERGMKEALLYCQLNPKHWEVDQFYRENCVPECIIQNWREEQQLTNNMYVLVLTNAVLKGGSRVYSVDGKRNILYCDISVLDEDHALHYYLNWPK
ncbi:MAG: hypothetical protein J6W73_04215 [Verrucomicrobia bacterium]|nr:hypothetical protein [Verrucomicrobiota bacterium]